MVLEGRNKHGSVKFCFNTRVSVSKNRQSRMMLRFGFHRGHQTRSKTVAKTRAMITVEVQAEKNKRKAQKGLAS